MAFLSRFGSLNRVRRVLTNASGEINSLGGRALLIQEVSVDRRLYLTAMGSIQQRYSPDDLLAFGGELRRLAGNLQAACSNLSFQVFVQS